jgi:DNA-binding transcriptional regulator YiaG
VTLSCITINKCERCGAEAVVIPALRELNKLLSRIVASKPGPLTKEELRFLRKIAGMGKDDFGAQTGHEEETVADWEEGRKPIPPLVDLMARVVATTTVAPDTYQESFPDIVGTSSQSVNTPSLNDLRARHFDFVHPRLEPQDWSPAEDAH